MADILFIEKVFLAPCAKEPRGVEVFNLNLIRDLAALGHRVTVVADSTWRPRFDRRYAGGIAPDWVEPHRRLPPVLAGAVTAFRLRRSVFDVLLLGNVANRLIPMLHLIRRFGLAPRCVLIAHREPSRRSVGAQRAWPTSVIAVNGKIAGHYTDAGFQDVEVRYGITDADRFHPLTEPREKNTVDFCIVGDLNSRWKGSDTAIEAYKSLPPEVREKARLHLASFREPRESGDPGIVAHEWMPFDRMPEFLRKMDVMLVPSRDEGVMRETFSQAAVQGMLTALPIVVSDLPVLTEKIDEGGGLVFHDTVELVGHMTRLVGDAALRRAMGEQARRTALTRYVWDTAAFASRHL
jgi:glycosyltransferase involved in cell wall biosynthesis